MTTKNKQDTAPWMGWLIMIGLMLGLSFWFGILNRHEKELDFKMAWLRGHMSGAYNNNEMWRKKISEKFNTPYEPMVLPVEAQKLISKDEDEAWEKERKK